MVPSRLLSLIQSTLGSQVLNFRAVVLQLTQLCIGPGPLGRCGNDSKAFPITNFDPLEFLAASGTSFYLYRQCSNLLSEFSLIRLQYGPTDRSRSAAWRVLSIASAS